MRHSGRNIFKGTTYQTLAQMSLTLQYLRDPNFSYIHLEAPDSNDFNLVFKDGHKIICEAKDWSRGLQDHDVKKIIDKLSKSKIVSPDDEILIICSKYTTDIFEQIRNLAYFPETFENEFNKKGYSKKQIKLVSKLNVWLKTRDELEEGVHALFTEIIGFWLPDEDIKEFVRSVLIQRFHRGSAEGNIYTRGDIFSDIESKERRIKKSSSRFNKDYNNCEEQIDKLLVMSR